MCVQALHLHLALEADKDCGTACCGRRRNTINALMRRGPRMATNAEQSPIIQAETWMHSAGLLLAIRTIQTRETGHTKPLVPTLQRHAETIWGGGLSLVSSTTPGHLCIAVYRGVFSCHIC
jgi:hypothetical protein